MAVKSDETAGSDEDVDITNDNPEQIRELTALLTKRAGEQTYSSLQ